MCLSALLNRKRFEHVLNIIKCLTVTLESAPPIAFKVNSKLLGCIWKDLEKKWHPDTAGCLTAELYIPALKAGSSESALLAIPNHLHGLSLPSGRMRREHRGLWKFNTGPGTTPGEAWMSCTFHQWSPVVTPEFNLTVAQTKKKLT